MTYITSRIRNRITTHQILRTDTTHRTSTPIATRSRPHTATADRRHTCATLLIETGVPLITVKELLGHANIAVTANIYTHTRLPHQADALKQLDARLDEPEPKPRRRHSTETPSATEGDIELISATIA